MKIYIVIYEWEYEYSKNILVTINKALADGTAERLNKTAKDAESYKVEELVLDKEYKK